MVTRDEVMRRIRQPASAAIAGIAFAVMLGAVIALLRSGLPEVAADTGLWTQDPAFRDRVGLSLNLIPFAGIAFLWFIAVLRAQMGESEDRFVGTVFLGSGMLFVASMFTAAASLSAVLTLLAAGIPVPEETRAFAWVLASSLLGTFGVRMAAVFVASVATAGRRSGALPKWLAYSGYAVAVLLLVNAPLPTLTQFLFPIWILVLSGYLLTGRHQLLA